MSLSTDFDLKERVRAAVDIIDVIGATTEPGRLPPPFRSRFTYDLRLTLYDPIDLARILRRGAGRRGVAVTPDAALRLARISRGTPRTARACLTTRATADGAIPRACAMRVRSGSPPDSR